MKTPSTELFQLIRSMTAQEKKYFRQYAQLYSRGRTNSYELLFDAVDAQAEYDEAAIKKQFAEHDFARQLSVAKNYLFEKVLDALMEMHADDDESLHIEQMIGRFEFLFHRNLIGPALTFYQRAEKKALENDNLTLLPHILRQKNLLMLRSEAKYKKENLEANAMQAIEHTRALLNFLEYEMLSAKVSAIFTDPRLGYDPALTEELHSIMSHPLFADENMALSFKAWHYYSKTKYRYLHVVGKQEECYDFIKNSITYLEAHQAENSSWQVAYFRTQSDLMNLSIALRRFDGCKGIFDSIEQMIAESFYPLPIIRQSYLYYKLLYHATSGQDVAEAIKFWESSQPYWQEIKNNIELPSRHSMMYDVLRLYFKNRDWRNAIIAFNELIDHKTLNIFEAPARIYWLMLQYEIDNLGVLPNLTHNAAEWFRKNKMMNPLEKICLKFFDNIPKAVDKKSRQELFEKLKADIRRITAATIVQDSSINYDLLDWIDLHLRSMQRQA